MSTYADAAAYTLIDGRRHGLILALHGLTATRAQPLAYLEDLGDDYGVLAPDLRAHGATAFSGAPADFLPAHLAADLESLADRLGLASRPTCVLGISLGATVGLELLRRRRLDVRAAIFIRPSHASAPPSHLRLNALIASWLAEDSRTTLARLLASEEYREVAAVSESAAASLRTKATSPDAGERRMRLEQGATWTAFAPDEVVRTHAETLVLAAERDPLHPVAVAAEWHARMEGSTIVTLPPRDADPAGQLAMATAIVRGFIAQLTGLGAHPR